MNLPFSYLRKVLFYTYFTTLFNCCLVGVPSERFRLHTCINVVKVYLFPIDNFPIFSQKGVRPLSSQTYRGGEFPETKSFFKIKFFLLISILHISNFFEFALAIFLLTSKLAQNNIF